MVSGRKFDAYRALKNVTGSECKVKGVDVVESVPVLISGYTYFDGEIIRLSYKGMGTELWWRKDDYGQCSDGECSVEFHNVDDEVQVIPTSQVPMFECGRLLLTEHHGIWSADVKGLHVEGVDPLMVVSSILKCVSVSGYYSDGKDEHGVKGYNFFASILGGPDAWIDDMPTIEDAMKTLWSRIEVLT